MSRRSLHVLGALVVMAVVAAIAGATSSPGHAKGISLNGLNKIQKRLISGSLAMSLTGATSSGTATCGNTDNGGDEPDEAPSCPPDSYSPAPGGGGGAGSTAGYSPSGNGGCAVNRGNNIKVNQECLTISDGDLQGRGQSQNEESIAVDPNNSKHVVASQNDYRRGDGNCYAAYSLDSGKNWNDSTVPMSFTRGLGTQPREYWQAGGDTSVAWDTRGNAYLSCQVFNRGAGTSPNADASSGFMIMRSTQNNGGSWNFPGRYTTSFFDPAGTTGVLEDKALMAIDDNVSSPFRDRIYVTWTEFAADGTAYIYEVHSDNYGESFSPRVLVSADNGMCPVTFGLPTPQGNCNENQFSDPFVGPDG
ncbi:MAG TPA: hypothetical protein VKG23_04565, partial [Thermoanaerobaculia bacterium]|nr:hypothetical protein [Thermoanaerobaculia bacterium]